MKDKDPCMCGDPECRSCFYIPLQEKDEDEAYDEWRQAQIDEETE
jgi:hypothetical protein